MFVTLINPIKVRLRMHVFPIKPNAIVPENERESGRTMTNEIEGEDWSAGITFSENSTCLEHAEKLQMRP